MIDMENYKKLITIYFGKEDHGMFGNTANTLKVMVENGNNTVGGLTHEKWVRVLTEGWYKMINTEKILWFEVWDIPETKKEESENKGANLIISLFRWGLNGGVSNVGK